MCFMISLFLISTILCPTELNYDLPWWKHTIIYEVFIRSFKDSDGDGVGDIKGITEKLDHFVDLNVETLWLTPFVKSPMEDMGYDVSDFMQIDPIFGTMADLKNLISGLKRRKMKFIMDLVLNHTSNQHQWFKKSIDEINPYTDYYIWQDPSAYDRKRNPLPPNNWRSIFGGRSSWTFNKKRQQYYYHAFSSSQPDLNHRNIYVFHEIQKIVDFWINKGVDGFRIDAAPFIMGDKYFRDEENRSRAMTMNIWDTYRLLNKLRLFLDEKYNVHLTPQTQIILVVEAVLSYKYVRNYYGKKGFPVAHYPFNFDFLLLPPMENEPDAGQTILDTEYFDYHVLKWLNGIPAGEVVNWVSEMHDLPRISDRLNPGLRDILVTMTMMLPGTVSIYYGQEIGMSGMELKDHQKKDKYQDRDDCRTPMQWTGSNQQAGFSNNPNTWLPVNPNFKILNVEMQKRQKYSRYKMFKALTSLRQTETIKFGRFDSYRSHYAIYMFTRRLENFEMYIVILNLNKHKQTLNLSESLKFNPKNLRVATASVNMEFDPGTEMPEDFNLLHLPPHSTVVFVADDPSPPTSQSPIRLDDQRSPVINKNNLGNPPISIPANPNNSKTTSSIPVRFDDNWRTLPVQYQGLKTKLRRAPILVKNKGQK